MAGIIIIFQEKKFLLFGGKGGRHCTTLAGTGIRREIYVAKERNVRSARTLRRSVLL